ncbi:MAG: phosphonoacetaldehyde reductase [Bacillus sp. (in: Bacteria)]|nr:phosphonoacetaldehyde reductase [Bacillus sp. (in: firmicutes)]
MEFKPFCQTEITFSSKTDLEQTLLSLRTKNIALIMSESSSKRWGMTSFINTLKFDCEHYRGSFTWIKKVAANPTQRDIINSLEQISTKNADVIIALGGGSAIDLAKGISAFYQWKDRPISIEEITESIKNKQYMEHKFVDIIGIPTTSGTGSEVTQWATVWDENKNAKFSIDAPGLKPKKAIIVPELTVTVPQMMTLTTGLDAMCQAIEAYWSKHTNPIVQEIAYRSVELITQNLRKAVDSPDDIISREKLCKGSVLAGLAFSQTRTTACHSISYPLTMLYGVPHGIAVSLTLDPVAQINRGSFPNDNEIFELFHEFGGIKEWMKITTDGYIEMNLSSFGVTDKDIPIIVENAFTGGRMDNNPVDLTKEDVTNILKTVMK